ncbi:hypothetical protein BaRGS_00020404 [Batillaria attramentaria]|uniref:Uncharacterized protein n=1 Tax=Batillaria attramentaria TaxID=370345 RepID=A0ABD0KMI0_9CAEN
MAVFHVTHVPQLARTCLRQQRYDAGDASSVMAGAVGDAVPPVIPIPKGLPREQLEDLFGPLVPRHVLLVSVLMVTDEFGKSRQDTDRPLIHSQPAPTVMQNTTPWRNNMYKSLFTTKY